MTGDRWEMLARYNGERAHGLVHTPEWVAKMAVEQAAFDAEMAAEMTAQGGTPMAGGGWLIWPDMVTRAGLEKDDPELVAALIASLAEPVGSVTLIPHRPAPDPIPSTDWRVRLRCTWGGHPLALAIHGWEGEPDRAFCTCGRPIPFPENLRPIR